MAPGSYKLAFTDTADIHTALGISLSFNIVASDMPVAGKATFSTPAGGDSFKLGSVMNIAFIRENLTAGVQLFVANPDGTQMTAIEDTAILGSTYAWAIPATGILGSYKLMAVDKATMVLYGTSNTFAVTALNNGDPTTGILFTSPAGNESWLKGNIIPIAFTRSVEVANVSVTVLLANSVNGYLIGYGPMTTNTFNFTVPTSQADGQYWFRAVNSTTGAVLGISNKFNIVSTIVAPPGITLTSPVGQEQWEEGSTHAITWTRTSFANTVRVSLEALDVVAPTVQVGADTAANTVSLVIPANKPVGQYRITITDPATGGIFTASYPFVIKAPAGINPPPPTSVTGRFNLVDPINWWNGTAWKSSSMAAPSSTNITFRLKIDNTCNLPATFRGAVKQYSVIIGYTTTYSNFAFTIPANSTGYIFWNMTTGQPGSYSVNFLLFSGSNQLDTATIPMTAIYTQSGNLGLYNAMMLAQAASATAGQVAGAAANALAAIENAGHYFGDGTGIWEAARAVSEAAWVDDYAKTEAYQNAIDAYYASVLPPPALFDFTTFNPITPAQISNQQVDTNSMVEFVISMGMIGMMTKMMSTMFRTVR
jgi:hypothetical protein